MKSLAMGATILKEALVAWNEDRVPRLGAALAYYTLFSLAPLLMIVVAVASLVFGEQAAQGQIADEIKGLVGDKGADAIQALLARKAYEAKFKTFSTAEDWYVKGGAVAVSPSVAA